MQYNVCILLILSYTTSIILNETFLKDSNHFVYVANISNNELVSRRTDKVTPHSYQTMYGLFLTPLMHSAHSSKLKVKMLEIGLGCGSWYGEGKSVSLWQHFFGSQYLDLWIAEFNSECAKNFQKANGGFQLVTGDQGDRATLHEWVKATGGNFDVIIDDGSHLSSHIKMSFDVLFRQALRPGGLYFLEDLSAAKEPQWFWKGAKLGYEDTNGTAIVIDVLNSWIRQLVLPVNKMQHKIRHKIPPGIKWIMCQSEACVVAKCQENEMSDPAKCSGSH